LIAPIFFTISTGICFAPQEKQSNSSLQEENRALRAQIVILKGHQTEAVKSTFKQWNKNTDELKTEIELLKDSRLKQSAVRNCDLM
jgi:cell division protein FtsB